MRAPALGFRSKLFLGILVLIVLVGGLSGVYLEATLSNWLEGRVELELLQHARTARELVEQAEDVESVGVATPLCRRLAQASGARVSIVTREGRLLGDSWMDLWQVHRLDRIPPEPEIVQALDGGLGIHRRSDSDFGHDMLYVAVSYQRLHSRGVVRVGMPTDEVASLISRLRFFILSAAVLGLVAAVLSAAIVSHLFSSVLRRLVTTVGALVGNDREPHSEKDELHLLSTSFHHLADSLARAAEQLALERDRFAKERRWFEVVLNSISEPVLSLDAEGRVLLANPVALRLMGAWPELSEILTREARAGFKVPELSGAGGQVVVVHASQLEGGEGHVIVLHDITELRRLDAIRRDFVANVSHELRTPVSIITANAEVLNDGALSDRDLGPQFLTAVLQNAQRLSSLLSDLLDLSKIESGRHRLDLQPLDLEKVITNVVDAVGPTAAPREFGIALDVSPGLMVWGDEHGLERALGNLLQNAINHGRHGGRATIRARSAPHEAVIEVEDDGPGVPAEHRDRIFERFYRVDQGRSRDTGGSGLGLAIVKHLVEGMGGTVTLSPAQPQGSIFRVHLTTSRSSAA